MPLYVVAYAKINNKTTRKITLNGVCYGGISDNLENAKSIAIECVNTIKGGVILPKIITLKEDDGLIVEALYEAEEYFDKVIRTMNESSQIVALNKR